MIAGEDIALSLRIADPALAERLADLLAGVPGLRLVAGGEPADVVLSDERLGPAPDFEVAAGSPRVSGRCWSC